MAHMGENDGAILTWSDVLDVVVSECVGVILAGSDADWSSKAGRLDWDCRATVLHLASDFVGYAGQLTAPRLANYVPFDVVLDGDPDAVGLAEVIRATGGLLSSVVRTASPETLSWHPFGMAGPVDFCAMGAVEALVHTHDLSQGLSVPWEPPGWLVGRVLGHLFDVDQVGEGHWSDLLLATGRIPDSNQVFVTSWRWHNTGS